MFFVPVHVALFLGAGRAKSTPRSALPCPLLASVALSLISLIHAAARVYITFVIKPRYAPAEPYTCRYIARSPCMRSRAPPLHRLTGQLSVATSSPWVWVSHGVDPTSAIYDAPPSRKRPSFRAEYVTPASLNHELPTAGRPEVAFCGRSNQGKSTLIGKLLGNSKIVRASKAPGCTQTVNYFALRETGGNVPPHAYLVDLPGYGFARESKKAVRGWNSTVMDYLEGRVSSVLRRTFVLVDSRHGLQPDDEEMLSFLSSGGVENMVLLTKVEKASPVQLLKSLEGVFQVALRHPATVPIVHCVSAHKGLGMGEFSNTLFRLTADR